jgi:DNA-binding GntR family transcriptional regulator
LGITLGGGEDRAGPAALAEALRRSIVEGEYAPRQRLIEEQLAERLGVSRTPVRQALTMLEAEGLVEIVPNRGAMVCSFSDRDVWEIYDLRAVLEGHAARRAASRIEAGDLERMGELAREMELIEPGVTGDNEVETRRLVSCNGEFHGAVLRASDNGRLEKLVLRTVQVPLVYKAFFLYGPDERVISNHYHRQILKALEQGDGERAEIVMREHVYEGRDFVLRTLQHEYGGGR